MIDPITDLEYYEELPEGYIKMPEYKEIFMLKEGEIELTVETSQIRTGIVLILFNPATSEYYPRYISNASDTKKLLQYFKDGNLYIKENDLIWSKLK